MIVEYKKFKEEVYDEVCEEIYNKEDYKQYNIVALLLKPILTDNGIYKIESLEHHQIETLEGIKHYINKKNHNNDMILKIKRTIEKFGAIECKTKFEGLQINESAIILKYIRTKNYKFIFDLRILTRLN